MNLLAQMQMNEARAAELTDEAAAAFMTVFLVVFLFASLLSLIGLIGMWKSFAKAGQPGWAAIIPIYNAVVLLEMAGRPIWWILLLLIPGVNFVVIILVMIDLAARFGKGAGFGIGLALLGFVFWPILGFGDARYQRAR